jgi:hypothetical protein
VTVLHCWQGAHGAPERFDCPTYQRELGATMSEWTVEIGCTPRATVIVLVFCLVSWSAYGQENCDGAFKGGKRPSEQELREVLAMNAPRERQVPKRGAKSSPPYPRFIAPVNFCGADLRGVDFRGQRFTGASFRDARLDGAVFDGAQITNVDFRGASLKEANFRQAEIYDAKFERATLDDSDLAGAKVTASSLFYASLVRARLNGAHFREVDLRRANLREADLTDVQVNGANLEGTLLWGARLPREANWTGLKNLETVEFGYGQEVDAQLAILRDDAKRRGLSQLHRLLTRRIWWNRLEDAGLIERVMLSMAFGITVDFGNDPWGALRLLVILIPYFALIYLFSVWRRWRFRLRSRFRRGAWLGRSCRAVVLWNQKVARNAGIWRVWSRDRLTDLHQQKTLERLQTRQFYRAALWSLYFSLLSAFHIGWRDWNVGTWLQRMQPREYTLRPSGAVRTLAGAQALVSVYLLALWALCYFGNPFG